MRYCPHCAGDLVEKVLGDQSRLVCSRCGYVFYINPKVAAGVLVEQDGHILLVRRDIPPRRSSWNLPSGHIEYDESAQETAVRECKEETGLEVELGDVFNVYAIRDDPRGNGILIIFRAKICGGLPRPGGDAQEVAFFPATALPEDIAFDHHRHALREWRASLGDQHGR